MKHKQLCESHVHLKTNDDLKLFLGHVHTSRRLERGEQIATTDIPALGIATKLRVESSWRRGARSGFVSRLPEHAWGNASVARFGSSGACLLALSPILRLFFSSPSATRLLLFVFLLHLWLRPDSCVTCVQPQSRSKKKKIDGVTMSQTFKNEPSLWSMHRSLTSDR